jgi:AcrR family transcriptional regulator
MQNRSIETHNQILNTALSEFAAHGYEATSVSQICTSAGVSKGAFYHHFPSKQALFLELLNDWLDRIDLQIKSIRDQSTTVPQALMTMTGLMENIYQAAGENLPLFLEFWVQASQDRVVWQQVINPYRRYQRYFAGMIQAGIDEGSIKDVDPHMTARVMVGLAVGLLLQGVLDPYDADWGNTTQYGFQMILNDLIIEEA